MPSRNRIRPEIVESFRVLLVETESPPLGGLAPCFGHPYEVEVVDSATHALARAVVHRFHLIVVSSGLPSISGPDLCEEFRRREIDTPILLLTGANRVSDTVEGLRRGADDCLAPPFAIEELRARSLALIQRTLRPHRSTIYECDGLTVDFGSLVVMRVGTPASALTEREAGLLRSLISQPGRTLSRAELLIEAWGYEEPLPNTRTVDVHIMRLRQKVEENPRRPRRVVTVRGVGYRFNAADPSRQDPVPGTL